MQTRNRPAAIGLVHKRGAVLLAGLTLGMALPLFAQSGADHPVNVAGTDDAPATSELAYGEPYELAGDRLVFTNWLFVHQGGLAWAAADDRRNVSANWDEPIGDWGAYYCRALEPSGIRLAVEPAQRRGPIIEPAKPWESVGVEITTMFRDGDRYRAWGMCEAPGKKRYHCYFESNDGENWQRPSLGLVEYDGSRDNNLIDFPTDSVFIDPTAPPEERYKLVTLSTISRQEYEAFKRQRPDGWEPRADRGFHVYAIRGAVSPDGIHWSWSGGIFNVEHSDTQLIGMRDVRTGEYVIYTRNYMIRERSPRASADMGRAWWTVGRRSIGRTANKDFRQFNVSDVVLAPTPDMRPYDVLYTNAYTRIPGAPDHHVMFPAIWDRSNDETFIRVATSHDNKLWQFAPGAPVLRTNTFGQFDGGCVFARINLVEQPDGDWVLPYTGYRYPHKYPRGSWAYHTGYAVWPKGRLFALVADEHGRFSTVGLYPPGNKLFINAVTTRAGSIRVQVNRLGESPVPHRTFDDCIPICGDQHWTQVTWKPGDDLGVNPDEPVTLRFELYQAKIYGLEFRDGG